MIHQTAPGVKSEAGIPQAPAQAQTTEQGDKVDAHTRPNDKLKIFGEDGKI